MADDGNRTLPVMGVGKILHFVINAGCAFGNQQQAVIATERNLIAAKAALPVLDEAIAREAEDLKRPEFFSELLDKGPEVNRMIRFR